MAKDTANEDIEAVGWRVRSVERAIESARTRALDRSHRILEVTTELIREHGLEFTVNDVVARSKVSMRSFYQHFSSKDDLLVAVFEEIIHIVARDLHDKSAASSDDPLEQLRATVTGLYELVAATPSSRALVVFHLGLAENRPDEFRLALDPLVAELTALVRAAAEIGEVRTDIEAARVAAWLVQTVVTALQMSSLGASLASSPTTGEEMWMLCVGGISPKSSSQ
jgi:AcrR family transcriptional regulator